MKFTIEFSAFEKKTTRTPHSIGLRDVRNPIECGVRVVFFSNAEELNRKLHVAAFICATNRSYELIHNCQ